MKIIVLGSGESADATIGYMPDDMHIAAISSGWKVSLRPPEHLFTLDHPKFFVGHDARQVHTSEGGRNYWEGEGAVSFWPHTNGACPCFDVTRPTIAGHVFGIKNISNSLPFAVQVLPRLGYSEFYFVGCDLHAERWAIAELLRLWHPIALKAGISWFNASHSSALSAWMPAADMESLKCAYAG